MSMFLNFIYWNSEYKGQFCSIEVPIVMNLTPNIKHINRQISIFRYIFKVRIILKLRKFFY